MKKQITALTLAAVLACSSLPVSAAEPYTASLSAHSIYDDEVETDMNAINVNGANYIHMNDFAAFVNTEIEYLPDAINITLNYKTSFTDAPSMDYSNLVVEENDKKFLIQNIELEESLHILKINGEYYISINDVAMLTDSDIIFDPAGQLVLITRYGGYKGTSTLSYNYKENNLEMSQYIQERGVPLSTLTKEAAGLDQYNIILLGEYHGNQKTYETELSMIQFLYENYGINHIFLETGHSDGVLLNQYIQTGDTEILDRLFSQYTGTFNYNKSNYEYYQALYEYNQTLPEEKKLVVTGTDLQHQILTGVYYLSTLLPNEEIPNELEPALAFLTTEPTSLETTTAAVNNLLIDIVDKEEQYKDFLDAAFVEFAYALNNMKQRFEYQEDRDGSIREAYMIENFLYKYNTLNGEKCMGIYGAAHTLLNADTSGENQVMASYLNALYPDSIAAINFEYVNSHIFNPDDPSQPYVIATSVYLDRIKNDLPQEPLLCKLDETNSPFITNGTTKDFQYIIIIQNSPATHIYQPEE